MQYCLEFSSTRFAGLLLNSVWTHKFHDAKRDDRSLFRMDVDVYDIRRSWIVNLVHVPWHVSQQYFEYLHPSSVPRFYILFQCVSTVILNCWTIRLWTACGYHIDHLSIKCYMASLQVRLRVKTTYFNNPIGTLSNKFFCTWLCLSKWVPNTLFYFKEFCFRTKLASL